MPELLAKQGVHPEMITRWKRRVQEGLQELVLPKSCFAGGLKEAKIKDLYAKIG